MAEQSYPFKVGTLKTLLGERTDVKSPREKIVKTDTQKIGRWRSYGLLHPNLVHAEENNGGGTIHMYQKITVDWLVILLNLRSTWNDVTEPKTAAALKPLYDATREDAARALEALREIAATSPTFTDFEKSIKDWAKSSGAPSPTPASPPPAAELPQ